MLVVDRVKNECFFLKWKTFNKDQRKGRELDPRHFDRVERQKFDASDAKEWQSFLDTGAVTVVPPEQAKKNPTDRIFKRPARIVRTDKNQMEGELHAKSRMVLPGDVDPDGENHWRMEESALTPPPPHNWHSTFSVPMQCDVSGIYVLLTFLLPSYTEIDRLATSIVDHPKTDYQVSILTPYFG